MPFAYLPHAAAARSAAATEGQERFARESQRLLAQSDAAAAALRTLRTRAEAGDVSPLQAYRAILEAKELHDRLLAAAGTLPLAPTWQRPHALLERALRLRALAGDTLLDASEPDGLKRLERATELADQADRASAEFRGEMGGIKSPSPRPAEAR